MAQNTSIQCPNCGHHFQPEVALERRLREQLQNEMRAQIAEKTKILNAEKETLVVKQQQLEAQKNEQTMLLEKRVAEAQKKIAAEALAKAREDMSVELEKLKADVEAKKSENLTLKKREVELMQQEHKLKDQQEQLQLDVEKQMLEKRADIEKNAREKEQERQQMYLREAQKKIDDQNKLIEEMRRKSKQGSMQLQGEAQELALQEILSQRFVGDDTQEVAKGVRGADVIQIVSNDLHQPCGKIIFESKRTKTFITDWIPKLKKDQMETGADIAVIVTEVLPNDVERFGQKDGVWICRFPDVGPLTAALREVLIQSQTAKVAQENKGDKMEFLYQYLTGNEFKQRVEAIVEGFSEMQIELEKEKRAMAKIWKAREKQIDKIISNTVDMYGSVRGIAGNAVAPIPLLELDNS